MFSALALAAALSTSPLSPDRALVAMPAPTGGVYLSWRLLKSDAPTMGFDVYRVQGGTPIKVNSRPITATSDFIDAAGNLATHDYYVTTSGNSNRTPLALEAINDNAFAISYPGSSHSRKFATADLDGDGRILQMRKRDDAGSWKKHPDDARIMIPRGADERRIRLRR